MRKIVVFSAFLVLMSQYAFSADIPPQIVSAFSAGDVSKLSEYFNQNIDLTLLNKEEIYSKTQAEMILRNFFNENKPTQFNILHQGGKENSKYAIGNLICGTKAYRVTFLLKTEDGKLYIHQLRIENDYVE